MPLIPLNYNQLNIQRPSNDDFMDEQRLSLVYNLYRDMQAADRRRRDMIGLLRKSLAEARASVKGFGDERRADILEGLAAAKGTNLSQLADSGMLSGGNMMAVNRQYATDRSRELTRLGSEVTGMKQSIVQPALLRLAQGVGSPRMMGDNPISDLLRQLALIHKQNKPSRRNNNAAMIGSIGGAIAGSFFGPGGTMLGSSAGSTLGGMFGGGGGYGQGGYQGNFSGGGGNYGGGLF